MNTWKFLFSAAGEEKFGGKGIFSGGGMSKFLACQGRFPSHSPIQPRRENPGHWNTIQEHKLPKLYEVSLRKT